MKLADFTKSARYPRQASGWKFAILSVILSVNIIFLTANVSHAQNANSCPWVATAERPIEEISREVGRRSGKSPTVSCGAGEEFKVCHSCQDRLTPEQWRKIQLMLSETSFRNWHTSWHAKSWDASLAKAGNPEAAQEIFGESFFYTHRELIRSVQANLASMGLPCITPWAEPPKKVDDPIWPSYAYLVTQNESLECGSLMIKQPKEQLKIILLEYEQGIKQINAQVPIRLKETSQIKDRILKFEKEEEIFQLSNQEIEQFQSALIKKHEVTAKMLRFLLDCQKNGQEDIKETKDELKTLRKQAKNHEKSDYLKSSSLGGLGYAINESWHGSIHGLYNTDQPEICSVGFYLPECDDMANPVSSHVNIHFYKAHGFVDNFVKKWLNEKELDSAEVDCHGNKKCYQWKGKFVGDLPDFVTGKSCVLDPPQEAPSSKAQGAEGED